MSIIRLLTFLVLCLILSGCSTTGKILMAPICLTQWGCGGVDEIKDPSARISNPCASALPPPGEGWTIVRHNGWWITENLACAPIMFGKSGKGVNETYIAYVARIKIPEFGSQDEFLKFMREKYSGISKSKRYEVVEFEQGRLMSERKFCTMHSYLVKDTGVSEKYWRGLFMYLEDVDINCRDPYDEKMGFTVSYSHRYNPRDEDPAFHDEANEFFANVEFLK